jgi:hypothetical protein
VAGGKVCGKSLALTLPFRGLYAKLINTDAENCDFIPY